MVRKRKIEKIVTYHIDLYLDVAWTSSNDMSWTISLGFLPTSENGFLAMFRWSHTSVSFSGTLMQDFSVPCSSSLNGISDQSLVNQNFSAPDTL